MAWHFLLGSGIIRNGMATIQPPPGGSGSSQNIYGADTGYAQHFSAVPANLSGVLDSRFKRGGSGSWERPGSAYP